MPAAAELAVVIPYFNPCGYRSRRRNFDACSGNLASQGVPVYAAEVVFGDGRFELPPNDRTLRLRARDVMWHKEGLINAVVRHLPARFRKVAWLDGDVLFEERSWPLRA